MQDYAIEEADLAMKAKLMTPMPFEPEVYACLDEFERNVKDQSDPALIAFAWDYLEAMEENHVARRFEAQRERLVHNA